MHPGSVVKAAVTRIMRKMMSHPVSVVKAAVTRLMMNMMFHAVSVAKVTVTRLMNKIRLKRGNLHFQTFRMGD